MKTQEQRSIQAGRCERNQARHKCHNENKWLFRLTTGRFANIAKTLVRKMPLNIAPNLTLTAILTVFLVSCLFPLVSEAQAQGSYVVIHAVNPEGVEIASIEGMGQFFYEVEIFDGPDLIGYAAHNDETHNVPIPIAPGTHTLRAVFNGMTQEQVITLDPAETRGVVFTFERSEVNIQDLMTTSGGTSNSVSGSVGPGISPWSSDLFAYEYHGSLRVSLGRSRCSWRRVGYIGSPPMQYWTHSTEYEWSQTPESFTCNGVSSIIFEPPGAGDINYLGVPGEMWFNGIDVSSVFTGDLNFSNWFAQQVILEEYEPFSNIASIALGSDIPFDGRLLTPGRELNGYWWGPQGYYLKRIPQVAWSVLKTDAWGYYYKWTEEQGVEVTEFSHDILAGGLKFSSVPYDLPGTGIQCGGGGQQPPECAFNAENPVWENEDDEMVLPYDEVDLKFEFTNTAPNPVTNVRVGFLSNSELFTLMNGIEEIGPVAAGGTFTSTNRMKVAGTDNDTIMNEIIKASGSGELSLEDTIEVMVTADECSTPCLFTLSPSKNVGGEILAIQYPDFSKLAGTPVPSDDEGGFYKDQGDIDFHHPSDNLVRNYAIEASVYDDSVFPDNVPDVMENMYRCIDNFVGDADPPKPPANDEEITKKIGVTTQSHICITQAYLFGSFARTIGVPAREITVALGTSIGRTLQYVFGIYYPEQEAAVQVWYDNEWHLYDTYLEQRSLDGYLYFKHFFAYRAWCSFDRQETPFIDSHLRGHKFSIKPLTGSISDGYEYQWKHLHDDIRPGIVIVTNSPVHTYLVDDAGQKTGFFDGEVLQEIYDSYYLPSGFRTYADASDPSSFVDSKETIFVGQSTGPMNYSLVVTGTDEGGYEIMLAHITGDGVHVQTFTYDISDGEVHTYDISVDVSGEISITGIPARIDIDPDTLNLSNKGKWLTCYIELPEGFDVSLIDGGIVELNEIPAYLSKEGWARAEASEGNIMDHDGDGILARMVKFSLSEVQEMLDPGEVELTVSGELTDGTKFEGTDTIRVIDKGGRPQK